MWHCFGHMSWKDLFAQLELHWPHLIFYVGLYSLILFLYEDMNISFLLCLNIFCFCKPIHLIQRAHFLTNKKSEKGSSSLLVITHYMVGQQITWLKKKIKDAHEIQIMCRIINTKLYRWIHNMEVTCRDNWARFGDRNLSS